MKIPPEQAAILAKCFHPSGTFVEFPTADVETSIPARFEKIVLAAGKCVFFVSYDCPQGDESKEAAEIDAIVAGLTLQP